MSAPRLQTRHLPQETTARAERASVPGRFRRGGRVVEGARLESVYTGNGIAGSNPAPSASNSRNLSSSSRLRQARHFLHACRDFAWPATATCLAETPMQRSIGLYRLNVSPAPFASATFSACFLPTRLPAARETGAIQAAADVRQTSRKLTPRTRTRPVGPRSSRCCCDGSDSSFVGSAQPSPRSLRCSLQSIGSRVSAIRRVAVSSGGCSPESSRATMSGAKKLRRRRRVT